MDAEMDVAVNGEAEDCVMFTRSWMHLADRSFAVLQDIVRQRALILGSDQTEVLNRILADSSRYIVLLEEIHEQLSSALDQSDREEDMQENLHIELESFGHLILVWRLCQIVFLEHMNDFKGTFSATYVRRLMVFRDSIGPPLRIMPSLDASATDSQVWQNILRLVLIGELDQALSVLDGLSRQAKDSKAVDFLRLTLKNEPFFSNDGDADRVDAWRAEVSEILMEDVVEKDREVSRILRVLLGSYDDWAMVGHEFSSWLSFYISRLPYASGLVSPTVLTVDHHQFSQAFGACQVKTFPKEIDNALECILRLDWDGMFEVLRKVFRNTWFTVHMWDLINESKSLVSGERIDQTFSSCFREALIIEYAESAIRSGQWLPFVRYFTFCSSDRQERLKYVLNAFDFRTRAERNDVIAALVADGMTAALQEIYRRDSFSFVEKGDFQLALQAAQMTDEEFRVRIGNEYLQYIRRLRGEIKFLDDDKPVLALVPDSVLERLGIPGLVTLYENAAAGEDHAKALSYLLLLLKRTFSRDDVYDLIGKIVDCINQIRVTGNDIPSKGYQQIRQWLMMLPLTNLKPLTEPEKCVVAELQSQVCISVAWSVDGFSSSTGDRSVDNTILA